MDNSSGKHSEAQSLAGKLGWFSIGLGLAELFAPSQVAELIGLTNGTSRHPVLRAYGVRELVAGLGIFSQPDASRTAPWVWSRVAGDALDLTSLACAFFSKETDKTRLGLATLAVGGITAADIYCAQNLSQNLAATLATKLATGEPVHVTKTTVIDKPASELYSFWRDFTRLPQIMPHLQSVEVTGDRHSHWKAKGPSGSAPEWDAEMTEDVPNERIAWRSIGGDITNSGSVEFRRSAGNRGTVITVTLLYEPPGGSLGVAAAKLFGNEPGQEVAASLRALKQVMETGEIVHSDSSIHTSLHPAVPPSHFNAEETTR